MSTSVHAMRTRTGVALARRDVMCGGALGVASAALAVLAFRPFDLWPLVFVAWVPMLIAQHRVVSARWAGLPMGIALGGFSLFFLWGIPTPPVSWQDRLMPGTVALLVALGTTVIGTLDRRFHDRTGYLWFVVATPFAWTGIEFARSVLPLAGTWGWLSNALHGQPWLIQPVAVFGTPALLTLVLVVNYAVASAFIRRDRRGPLFATSFAVAWVCLSLLLLHDPDATLRVAAIQPGIGHDVEPSLATRTRAAATRGARLVVWNEDALRYDPTGMRGGWVRRLARDTGAFIVVGHSRPNGDYSKASVFSPRGDAVGTYDKEHAVFFQGERTGHAGRFPVYATAIGRIATIICFDGAFTDSARDAARGGAQLIALPAADWPGIARTSNALNVFRAAENRVPVVRSDTAYDSAIIDPYGRVLAQRFTPHGSPATLIADVALGSGRSPWVTFGPWFGWLAVAWLITYAALCGRGSPAASGAMHHEVRRRRHNSTDPHRTSGGQR